MDGLLTELKCVSAPFTVEAEALGSSGSGGSDRTIVPRWGISVHLLTATSSFATLERIQKLPLKKAYPTIDSRAE